MNMNLLFSMESLRTKFLRKFDINFYKMLSDDKILEQLDEILLDDDSDDDFIYGIEEFDEDTYEELIGKLFKFFM